MATTRYTYTDSNRIVRAVADTMDMLSPTQAVLLRLFGIGKDNLRMINPTSFPQDKIEWLTDTENWRTATLNEALDTTETAVDVASGHGARFKVGSLLVIGTEIMRVTSVATDTLTVVREWDGDKTTGDAHDDQSAIKILAPAALEGGSFPTQPTTTSSVVYNNTQILSYKLSASRSARLAPLYGDNMDPIDRELMKLWDDGGNAGTAAKDLAETFYYGSRTARTASLAGTMGGFATFVTTNATTGNSQQIDKPKIHSMLRSIVDNGGEVTHMIGSTYMIEKVAALYEDERRMTQESLLGGYDIQQVITPAHPMPISLIADYLCPTDKLYFVNTNYVGWVPYDEFQVIELAKTTDADDVALVGEYTFVARKENCMGYLHTLATA